MDGPGSRRRSGRTAAWRPGDSRRRTAAARARARKRRCCVRTRRARQAGPPPINREITISEGITVKELSEKLDVKANAGDEEADGSRHFRDHQPDARLQAGHGSLAREFGASTATVSYEEEAMQEVEEAEEKDLIKRAPVVTIMGHVDHGKTSLLDAIREANVAGKRSRRHHAAHRRLSGETEGQKIVFIDTPGHEAFTRMRSRGAKVTDIVVLVVAADDGVMPQTLEAIDHARAAKVPIIVAINKIDKPDAQPDRIKQQLSDRGLLAEDWGGDTVMVPVSARTKAEPGPAARNDSAGGGYAGTPGQSGRVPPWAPCSKRKLDRGRGPVATVLVRNGTLRVGDFFICGEVFGKVRAMISDRGEADPRSRAVDAGRGARSRHAARSRRQFPGGDRYRQGQADRQFPRTARLREAALAKPAA